MFSRKDLPRHLVGLVVLCLAIGIVAALFLFEIPEGNRDVALVILGTAIAWSSAVVAYHFGTSEGSSRKSEVLEGRQ